MNFMNEVEQIQSANQPEAAAAAAAASSSLRAQAFYPNEFHYKCKPDKDGNVGEILEFDTPFKKGSIDRNLPAPQNPYYADQFGHGTPAAQVVKGTEEKISEADIKTKSPERPDPCK